MFGGVRKETTPARTALDEVGRSALGVRKDWNVESDL
jgi:hypothetical protein